MPQDCEVWSSLRIKRILGRDSVDAAWVAEMENAVAVSPNKDRFRRLEFIVKKRIKRDYNTKFGNFVMNSKFISVR